MTTSHEIRLRSRPTGAASLDNFELAEVQVADPGPGEVQVRNLWMSVDPYMRARMNDSRSYIPPFEIGQPLLGDAVGEVRASGDPAFQPGDIVHSGLGWREVFNAPVGAFRKLDLRGLPAQSFVGAAGMPGLTAYMGLTQAASVKPSDVVFVSAAAGAVGSVACQIAKAMGCLVIGSAGGPEKVGFLKSIGVDHAIDYKAEPKLSAAILAGAPDGIDVYFDNVGTDHLEAALTAARKDARFALCGVMSLSNTAQQPPGPRNLFMAIGKRIRLQGFTSAGFWDYAAPYHDLLLRWLDQGKFAFHETVYEGLDQAPAALLGVLDGRNLGKMVVKLA
jgi:NADPH-dependent curcumin reductase CurA